MIGPVNTDPPITEWYYKRDGKTFGPTDLEGLSEMARSLHLREESLIWKEGSATPSLAKDSGMVAFPDRKQLEAAPLPVLQSVLHDEGLYRSSDERILLGFCGGLAHKFQVPVIVVRVLLAISLWLFVGWAYWLAIFLPARPTKDVASGGPT